MSQNQEEAQKAYKLGLENYDSNYELAYKYFSQAIELNPEFTDALYLRGWVLQYKFKNIEEAFNDYSQAIIIKTQHPDTYYNRGILYEEMG